MKVFLAGYNLDADVIAELKKNNSRQDITPETLSAAYARISRDPRPINELRRDARAEVEKSRKSNQKIIFGLGHSSVAEHAVFNFDVIDVSRRAMEELEKFRLCSYTEKSQRYITLDSAYITPPEICGTHLETDFHKLQKNLMALYERCYAKLKTYVWEKHAALAAEPQNKNLLEGWAKEDARYITSLAVGAQAGLTLNARNLEKMLRRFASHSLQEIRDLGVQLHTLVKDIAPSIIKYPEANAYDRDTYADLRKYTQKIIKKNSLISQKNKTCRLIDYTKSGDAKILAALTARSTNLPYKEALSAVQKMTMKQKRDIFKICVQNMQMWDVMLREYELAELTFELIVSASCFAQLKRHRLLTLLAADYEPALGLRLPPALEAAGLAGDFVRAAHDAEKLYARLKKENPAAADYALTNAHQRRVICKVNLRELYHISRLREDAHAQWDIREIAALLTAAAREVFPLTASFLGGKDKYAELHAEICG
ncbi:FAD-dependent thymidylate synthase [Candidatus Termititenax aidoneus]|uniref:FAD-dependent thymidylate synthase n=1 Tax=Termititenax aidoneus TaxID=2218524 RepID=A0A388T816_TERA1|nr:FAD-dependent thymidylate synthase [Candidatus Termititenax aidoneus]